MRGKIRNDRDKVNLDKWIDFCMYMQYMKYEYFDMIYICTYIYDLYDVCYDMKKSIINGLILIFLIKSEIPNILKKWQVLSAS